MRYILANSVKEGLVKHPRYWPGVHCYRHLVEGTKLHGIWIDRTAKYLLPHMSERELTTNYTLKLAKLPCYEHLSDFEYRAVIRELTNEALAECDVSKSPVGQKRILAMDPHTRPVKTGNSPAPLCHSGCTKKTREFKAAFWGLCLRLQSRLPGSTQREFNGCISRRGHITHCVVCIAKPWVDKTTRRY